MKAKQIIKGKFINLRPVEISDAEFILRLRLDENLSKFVNKVSSDVELQKKWIANQISRENDYYFIIEDKFSIMLGTISLYNIDCTSGEFGRWISIGSAIQNIESVILLHNFGFYDLNLELIHSNTVVENLRVISFHKSFGATLTDIITIQPGSGLKLRRAEVHKNNYEEISKKNYKLINFLHES